MSEIRATDETPSLGQSDENDDRIAALNRRGYRMRYRFPSPALTHT